MAKFFVVPEKDMKVLRKYLDHHGEDIILMPQVFHDAQAKELQENFPDAAWDYNLCSEPDVAVEIVKSRKHYFMCCAREYGSEVGEEIKKAEEIGQIPDLISK